MRPLWYQNSGSRPWAVVVFVVVVVIAVIAGIDGSVPVVLGALLFGLLAYASIWRPAVGIDDRFLLLRDMYSTRFLPLREVDAVAVHRTFAATVAGRRYVSSALGRSLRENIRGSRSSKRGPSYVDVVEEQLVAGVRNAGFAGTGEETVRREWAWIELAVTAVVLVAFVVSLFV